MTNESIRQYVAQLREQGKTLTDAIEHCWLRFNINREEVEEALNEGQTDAPPTFL